MYMHPKDIEDLYSSIHRLAQKHVPDCTIEQTKKTANRFYDRSTTRLQFAFVLYWELAENRIEDSSADRFLELLRERVKDDEWKKNRKKVAVTPSLRDYWKA